MIRFWASGRGHHSSGSGCVDWDCDHHPDFPTANSKIIDEDNLTITKTIYLCKLDIEALWPWRHFTLPLNYLGWTWDFFLKPFGEPQRYLASQTAILAHPVSQRTHFMSQIALKIAIGSWPTQTKWQAMRCENIDKLKDMKTLVKISKRSIKMLRHSQDTCIIWRKKESQLDMFPGTWGCPRHVRFTCHTSSMHIQSTKAMYLQIHSK